MMDSVEVGQRGGPDCLVISKVTGLYPPVGQRALELDARAQPTLKEHSTLISLVI